MDRQSATRTFQLARSPAGKLGTRLCGTWIVSASDLDRTNGARSREVGMAGWRMNSRRSRAWLKHGVRGLWALLVLFVMFRWFEHSQVYHPYRQHEGSPAELVRPFEDIRFQSSDGVELHGWFFPAEAQSPRARVVFLVCHGNAGNISHRLELCRALLETGAGVMLFDYRGYGSSQGRPGEEGTYRDAQAAHAWLRQRGFLGGHIIVYGESLGGGVASELALRETVGGVVLQSTFTSIPDIGRELFPWLPVRWLSSIRYDTRAKLPRIKAPVLILHSREDELIRFHHAERNFAAAAEPKILCELRGAHNDGLWEQSEFHKAIEQLLRGLPE